MIDSKKLQRVTDKHAQLIEAGAVVSHLQHACANIQELFGQVPKEEERLVGLAITERLRQPW